MPKKQIHASVDENVGTTVEALVSKIEGNWSEAVEHGLRLLLREIAWTKEGLDSPEKLLQMITNLKSKLDDCPYTTNEILKMLKTKTISKKIAKSTIIIKQQMDALDKNLEKLSQLDDDVNASIKKQLDILNETDI
jgi:hypothetical protein